MSPVRSPGILNRKMRVPLYLNSVSLISHCICIYEWIWKLRGGVVRFWHTIIVLILVHALMKKFTFWIERGASIKLITAEDIASFIIIPELPTRARHPQLTETWDPRLGAGASKAADFSRPHGPFTLSSVSIGPPAHVRAPIGQKLSPHHLETKE